MLAVWDGFEALGLALVEAGADSMRSKWGRVGSGCQLPRTGWLALVSDTVERLGAGEGGGGTQG
jgi:hypothetical protein